MESTIIPTLQNWQNFKQDKLSKTYNAYYGVWLQVNNNNCNNHHYYRSGSNPGTTSPVFICKRCGHLQDYNPLSEPDTTEEVNESGCMNCHSLLMFSKKI